MNWKIKHFNELTLAELYKIVKQRINIFVVEQNCPYSDCDNKDLDSYHLYASEESQIIAYLRILLPGISYKEASIGRVLVVQKHRGKGLGTMLMKKGMNFIKKELNESIIRISAQEYVLNFYKDLGFKVVSDTYLEDGIKHKEMLYGK